MNFWRMNSHSQKREKIDECMKAESAEATNKMLEETKRKMSKWNDKSYQTHLKQLTEKMAEYRAQLMADKKGSSFF